MNATVGNLEWFNMIRRAAYYRVNLAVESGELDKPERCERCGEVYDDLHAHHGDYAKPLEVQWLCMACHKREHERVRKIYRETWPELADIFYEYGTIAHSRRQLEKKYKPTIEALEQRIEKQSAHLAASARK